MSSDNGYHVLDLPKFMPWVRRLQAVVAVVALALSAYALSVLNPNGNTYIAYDPEALTIFSAVATLIIIIYHAICARAASRLYNYWAIIACDVFLIIFWLSSMADDARWAAETQIDAAYGDDYLNNYGNGYTGGFSGSYYGNSGSSGSFSKVKRTTFRDEVAKLERARNCIAAAAGMAGLEFILFVVTLVITSIHVHRHRTSGAATAVDAETAAGSESMSQTYPQQPQPFPTQQTYVAPPQPYQAEQAYGQQPNVEGAYPQQYQAPAPAENAQTPVYNAEQGHANPSY